MILFNLILSTQIFFYFLLGSVLYFPNIIHEINGSSLYKLTNQKEEPKVTQTSSGIPQSVQFAVTTTTTTTTTTPTTTTPTTTTPTTTTTTTPSTTTTPTTTTPTTTTTPAPLTICTTTGCGVCTSITSSGGVISSPNYPADYGANRACIYNIQVPVGRTIQLTFTVFTLENQYDWINIYSGNNPIFSNIFTLGTSLTGYTSIPSPQTSTSNIMTVQFKSDFNNVALPFGVIGRWQAIYTVV